MSAENDRIEALEIQVKALGNILSHTMVVDQLVNRAMLLTLLQNEVDRGRRLREISDQVHNLIDIHGETGASKRLSEFHHQKARELADALFALVGEAERPRT